MKDDIVNQNTSTRIKNIVEKHVERDTLDKISWYSSGYAGFLSELEQYIEIMRLDQEARKELDRKFIKPGKDASKRRVAILTEILDNDSKLGLIDLLGIDRKGAEKLLRDGKQWLRERIRTSELSYANTMHLEPLIYALREVGVKQSKFVNLIYDLFNEFEIEDYGTEYYKGEFPNDTPIGEKEQKNRIKQWHKTLTKRPLPEKGRYS